MRTGLAAGRWGARLGNRCLPCAIGRGGMIPAADKREGDGASPAGAWRLLRGWWRADRLPRPRTLLPMAPIGPALGWCDDPEDPAYNRAVRLPHPASAERMRRGDPLYDIVIVLDHNALAVPGAGSAIFLHLWRAPRHPTAGCIALSRADMMAVLARWRPGWLLRIGPTPQGGFP